MSAPAPKLSRFPRLQLIWIVPVVAVAVASWMLYREWRNHGPEITIEFADGDGVEPKQTKLEYKGVPVGEVKAIHLSHDLHRVIVRVQLNRNAAAVARQGAQFWIVQPEIGFGGVSGLETLLTGARLQVRLGDGPPQTRFRGLEAPPAPEQKELGRAFLLRTDRLDNLQIKAPIFYRDIKVGEVEATRLADDATGVVLRMRIYSDFVPLVRTNTRFWNASSSPLSFSLFGGRGGQKKSLQTFISGAIAFATPDEPGEVAADGTAFDLNSEADKEWLKWHPAIPIKMKELLPEEPAQQRSSSMWTSWLGGN